jgi:hypothetical protein
MVTIDLPIDFLSNTFIFQNFVPFIILFAILFGLLESIGKFKLKTNLVVAVGFALIAAYTNPWVLSYIATLGSSAAVVLFGILFFFGIIRWGLGRGKDIYDETAPKETKIRKLIKEKEKWENKYRSARSDSEKASIIKRIEELKMQIEIAKRG